MLNLNIKPIKTYYAELQEYDNIRAKHKGAVQTAFQSLILVDFLTLAGIPEKAFDYRLGARSALEWIINQYCVKIDKRSGKVVPVSLETVDIVEGLPGLDLG